MFSSCYVNCWWLCAGQCEWAYICHLECKSHAVKMGYFFLTLNLWNLTIFFCRKQTLVRHLVRGVEILLYKNIPFKLDVRKADPYGKYLCIWSQQHISITMLNIYAPNNDSQDFLGGLLTSYRLPALILKSWVISIENLNNILDRHSTEPPILCANLEQFNHIKEIWDIYDIYGGYSSLQTIFILLSHL